VQGADGAARSTRGIVIVTRTTAREFEENVGKFEDLALREPVEITEQGRPHLVLLAADEYERLVNRTRRVFEAAEMPDWVVEAVAAADMKPEHGKLDTLIDD
jgi:hypothetical protein